MSSLLVFTPINLITYSTHRAKLDDTIEVQKSNIYFYCHVYMHTRCTYAFASAYV